MKSLLRPLSGLALCAGLLSETAFASTFCDIRPGFVTPPFNFIINLGSIYVPRDAPVGSVIGQLDRPFSATTVIQARCEVSVVSDNPVELGDWSKSNFTGSGYTTTPVDFSIALSSCNSDPGDVNVAWANIRLDGVNGSTPIRGAEGGFTLTSDSDAKGVGIQILNRDGLIPIKLGSNVPLKRIVSGGTILDLSARFYQTSDAQKVVAGKANGSLSFTISFL